MSTELLPLRRPSAFSNVSSLLFPSIRLTPQDDMTARCLTAVANSSANLVRKLDRLPALSEKFRRDSRASQPRQEARNTGSADSPELQPSVFLCVSCVYCQVCDTVHDTVTVMMQDGGESFGEPAHDEPSRLWVVNVETREKLPELTAQPR
ncbi:uncharacterized [Tachysurus ichikawai]